MIELLPSREIFLQIGDWEIRWYGVLYLLGMVIAWRWLPKLGKYRGLKLNKEEWLSVLTWGMAGVLVGGRLGYAFFYEPVLFFNQPLDLFVLSQGGMSSHGGFVGVGVALWLVSKFLRIDFLNLLDVVVVPVALGLALGRVGNWINQELYINDWAHGLAVVKNLIIAGVVYGWLRKIPPSPTLSRRGFTPVVLFLIVYSLLRFLTEYLRIQDYPEIWGLTRGQWLTLPVLLIGVLLYTGKLHGSTKSNEQ